MKQLFPESEYQTPPDTTQARFGRWAGTSLGFYTRFVRICLKWRSVALKGRYDDEAWAVSSHEIFHAVERFGGRVNIEGLEHLRASDEPVVFIGNHMTTAESQLLPSIIHPIKRFTFVVKRSLVRGPFFAPILRARTPIVVTRANPRKDMEIVLEEGMHNLKQGRSVVIFPTGERSLKWEPEKFSTLGIKLAKKAKVKVIPLALKTDFWGNGLILLSFGRIRRKKQLHFRFGEPRSVEGTGKELHQEILDFIANNLRRWQTL